MWIMIRMQQLNSSQRKYLRGLAHGIKPVVFVGQKGITTILVQTISEALDSHELIKIKFLEFKRKDQKEDLCVEIENNTKSVLVGLIGHIGIFYRPHTDHLKRRITLPDPH